MNQIYNLIRVFTAVWLVSILGACGEEDTAYSPSIPTTGKVFTVSVGIDKASVDQLGGESIVRTMMYTNFAALSRDFNSSAEFDEVHYFMDDFFVYEGTSKEQLDRSHSTDFTFLYNSNSLDGDITDGYVFSKKTFCLSNQTASISKAFSQDGIDYFRYAMAACSGAVEYGSGDVLVQNNQLSPSEYIAPSNIMNPFSLSDKWDDLTVALIKKTISGNAVDFTSYLPSSIEFTLMDEFGMLFSDVEVKVYPVRWRSGIVSEEPIFEGKTNTSGKIDIASNGNPYLVPTSIADDNETVFANLLIELNRDGIKKYDFLPLTEVLSSVVVDGNSSYEKTWEVSLKTLGDMTVVQYDFENKNDLDYNTSGIGAQTNTAFTSDAKYGTGAIEFNGSNYFVLNNAEQVSATQDYSVSFWFKTSTLNGSLDALWTMSDWSGLMGNDPWKPGGLSIRYDESSVAFDVGWEGGISGNVAVKDGQWHQIITTVGFTDDTHADITIFIDGVNVCSYNLNILYPTWGGYFNEGPGGAAPAEADNFVVKIGIAATENVTPFIGVVDDVRVFNTALDNSWAYRLFSGE